MAKIGYVRVSSKDQNLDRQYELLKPCNIERYFEEKVSGKNTDRPQLKAMLAFLREGDTVYVESFSRLARNTLDLLNLIEEFKSKGVAFVSIKEQIDTNTIQGEFMLRVFGAMSELERDQTRQRQAEGIRSAQARGQKFGRPKVTADNFEAIYRRWRAGELTAVAAMKELDMKPNSFYRRAKELEASK